LRRAHIEILGFLVRKSFLVDDVLGLLHYSIKERALKRALQRPREGLLQHFSLNITVYSYSAGIMAALSAFTCA
jgi:hypothetical protein